MKLALARPLPSGRPDNVVQLRRTVVSLHRYTDDLPDFAELARAQITNARVTLGQTYEEFAATLADHLDWPPSAVAVRGWEYRATPPGDAVLAAQFLAQAHACDLVQEEVRP